MCNIYIKVEQGVESYSKKNCYACACKKSKKSVKGTIGAIGENGTLNVCACENGKCTVNDVFNSVMNGGNG